MKCWAKIGFHKIIRIENLSIRSRRMKITFRANFEKATKCFHFGPLAFNLVLRQHIENKRIKSKRKKFQQQNKIKIQFVQYTHV